MRIFDNVKFLTTTALTAAGVLGLGANHAKAQTVAVDALPQGETVIRGAATFDRSTPNTLNIEQHQAITAAEYTGGFNIGRDASVIVDQRKGDIFVHKDTSADTSVIEGVFQGSASNHVLNRNGVLITGTARVDMQGGFAASTAENVDVNENSVTFRDLGDASVEIQEGATVNIGDAGLAAFVAPTVKNAGVINARMGTVALAAGETVTLDMYGDGLFEVAVEGELANALIENTGAINAEGGRVQVAATAAKDAVDNIINMDGVVNVSSVTQKGGKIILSGGKSGRVKVSSKAKLKAKGKTGGKIEVTGQTVVADSGAVLDASGTNGGGTIRFGGDFQGGGDVPTSDYAFLARNAILRANAEEEGDGGDIFIWSDLGTGFYGNTEAKGGVKSGNGGFVEISSLGFYDFAFGIASVDTTATNGITGTFLLDPRDIEIRGGTGDGNDGNGGNPNNGRLNPNGLIAFSNNNGSNPFVVYESEIEGQSANTNITLQARRNILTVAGGDNTVTLAANRSLTIETQNNVSNNNGSIDLTNLTFETQGTGDITITASTGTGTGVTQISVPIAVLLILKVMLQQMAVMLLQQRVMISMFLVALLMQQAFTLMRQL